MPVTRNLRPSRVEWLSEKCKYTDVEAITRLPKKERDQSSKIRTEKASV